MKKGIKIADSIIEKEITLRPIDIPEKIHRMVNEVVRQFGPSAEPKRILFGPNEWLLLGTHMRENQLYYQQFMDPKNFMGYPIGLKRSPGIEFEFDSQFAAIFAHGTVK